jgi:GNAT superfamily N-acetyltransferase
MTGVIRRLSTDDAASFRSIRLESLLADPNAFGAHLEEEASQPLSFFAERLASGRVSGAFEDGELVAIMGLLVPEGRKLRHKGLLWGVYARSAWRGRGLAGRLLDFVIAEAHQTGLEWINLVVSVATPTARKLYESRGFVLYGREPAGMKVAGADTDDELMTLRL